MSRTLFYLLLAFAVATCLALQPFASDPKRINDVVFGKGGDQELKLNLALPDGDGPFPAVVLIHGGGWKGGTYKDGAMNTLMVNLARKGFVAACIQYRLTPSGARFPAQIEDCKCAVRWLRGHAPEYHLDADHIGALGASAGGHLSLLLGLTKPEDGLEGKGDLKPEYAKLSSRVQAVVNVFGPTDLVDGNWSKEVEPLIVDLLGGPVADKTELARQASPLTYLQSGRDLPPILTFHGTKDRVVPYLHATRLHDALGKLQARGKLVSMEGEDHGWGGEKLVATIKQAEDFLVETLKRKP